MQKMKDFIVNLKKDLMVAPKFIRGILSFRHRQYRLRFVYVPEDKLWYIDMPWPGDRYNLAMVSGSDKLLSFLCEEEDGNAVTIDVLPRSKEEEHPGFFECKQTACTLLGGSFYDVLGLKGFNRDIWICPVTLTVLGHYPKYIYIRKVEKTMTNK